MPARFTIFNKIVILIVLLLVPIILIYSYSNKVSVDVVQDEIRSSHMNQLSFFLHQMDSNAEQLSMFPVILSSDPYIREYVDKRPLSLYARLIEQSRLREKLGLQGVSSGWTNELSLYIPSDKNVISSNIFTSYDQSYLEEHLFQNWRYERKNEGEGRYSYHFVRQIVEPATAKRLNQVRDLIQVSFSIDNIRGMLDQFKSGGKGDPFMMRAGDEPIMNGSSNSELVHEVMGHLMSESLSETGGLTVELHNQQYLVQYVQSQNLGWYLVDYVPVQKILTPITRSRNFFYVSIVVLLSSSLLAAFLLYRNVQIPIRKLIRSVLQIKQGDFSARINYKARNEFDFLFRRFNEMAEQIQELIENVYEERIRRREATLKQLQAQINPHFLYNSLFFIVNTSMLGDRDSVVAMAQNLGEYYRYTTRVENPLAPLREELRLVHNYLTIQNLRMQRLEFEINVPEAMQDLLVPRLLLQPIVENAIIHGFERKPGEVHIAISGAQTETENRLIVEDNGIGMTPQAIEELNRKLAHSAEEGMGFGTWNVHQRLMYQYGADAGLRLTSSADLGLKAILAWPRQKE
jgi:two-component system, sensor histidine kinase YesM